MAQTVFGNFSGISARTELGGGTKELTCHETGETGGLIYWICCVNWVWAARINLLWIDKWVFDIDATAETVPWFRAFEFKRAKSAKNTR